MFVQNICNQLVICIVLHSLFQIIMLNAFRKNKLLFSVYFLYQVSECSTLRQIQQQGGGLTGPFKEGVITKWLQSQNITELDYKRVS